MENPLQIHTLTQTALHFTIDEFKQVMQKHNIKIVKETSNNVWIPAKKLCDFIGLVNYSKTTAKLSSSEWEWIDSVQLVIHDGAITEPGDFDVFLECFASKLEEKDFIFDRSTLTVPTPQYIRDWCHKMENVHNTPAGQGITQVGPCAPCRVIELVRVVCV